MDQPGLAYARLADDIDHTQAGRRRAQVMIQYCKLTRPSDKLGQASLARDVKAHRPLAYSRQPIRVLGFGFSLDTERAGKIGFDQPGHQPVRRLADQHTAGFRLGLQPRGEITVSPSAVMPVLSPL